MSMDDVLPVRLYGTHIGDLKKISRAEVVFDSSDEGIERFGVSSTVLSNSLPLGPRTSTTEQAAAFFGGLLPEGKGLTNLAKQSGKQSLDVFGLLEYAGRDVAGAVQVGPEAEREAPSYTPITDRGVAEKFQRINDYALGSMSGGSSISGYQPKTTLALIDGQWMDGHNGAATTHILKPLPEENEALLHSEDYCLSLGRACSLTSFSSSVQVFAGSPALVIERYDRELGESGEISRIHQEDAAQALGLPWNTDSKFENVEPYRATMANVAALMTRRRRILGGGPDDRERLLSYAVFNVAVGNTDAHAKNFSMLHLANGTIELAPLYDVLPQILNPSGQLNMAMRINGQPFQPYATKDDLIQEGVTWGVEERRATKLVNETLEQLRYAVEDSDTSGVEEKVPLLIANQTMNLLNGKLASVTSGMPIALTKLHPVSALPRGEEQGRQPKGVPSGGEYKARNRREPDVHL